MDSTLSSAPAAFPTPSPVKDKSSKTHRASKSIDAEPSTGSRIRAKSNSIFKSSSRRLLPRSDSAPAFDPLSSQGSARSDTSVLGSQQTGSSSTGNLVTSPQLGSEHEEGFGPVRSGSIPSASTSSTRRPSLGRSVTQDSYHSSQTGPSSTGSSEAKSTGELLRSPSTSRKSSSSAPTVTYSSTYKVLSRSLTMSSTPNLAAYSNRETLAETVLVGGGNYSNAFSTVPAQQNPQIVFEHINEIGNKRIATLDYFRKV
jgi:hypothetical protein